MNAVEAYRKQCEKDDEFLVDERRPCSVIRRDVADAALAELEVKLDRAQRRALFIEDEYKQRCTDTASEWRRELSRREQAEAQITKLKEQLSNPTHHSFVMDVGVACLACPRTAGMDEMTGWVFTTDTGWVCPSCRAKWDGR